MTTHERRAADGSTDRLVTFIQSDEPVIKTAKYELTVTQTTNTEEPNRFGASCTFAVTGERFSFLSGEIDSVFPPDLSNGAFATSLPSVSFNRRTLPWERYLDVNRPALPWLAVLLLGADEAPTPRKATALDLIPSGAPITVDGETRAGGGGLPPRTLSYPGMNALGYGESPDQSCSIIDLPVAVFNRIAPSLDDMAYLAHVRQIEGSDTVANTDEKTVAIVLGNRIAGTQDAVVAYLVSLENMGRYLPSNDGRPATGLGGCDAVRLICYRTWKYFANTLDQSLEHLLVNLNGPSTDKGKPTTLQIPTGAAPPKPEEVERALEAQKKGRLDEAGSRTLIFNALGQGYVPMNQQVRHGNTSVAWYRGPLLPSRGRERVFASAASPDAANRYDPQTGLFDISYGAAWQLGQLLALQNKTYANALFNWKKEDVFAEAGRIEQEILERHIGERRAAGTAPVFEHLMARRRKALSRQPDPPEEVASFLAGLRLLKGVPFRYLVPHEQQLPPESIRFFHLDPDWIDFLIDGALSIGRTTSRAARADAARFARLVDTADAARSLHRPVRTKRPFARNADGDCAGFLLRSQVVSGWPNLQVTGFEFTDDPTSERLKLRLEVIGTDCVFCLFDGTVNQVAIHEPPEQLHCGVQAGRPGYPFSTTLRFLKGNNSGAQITDNVGAVPLAPLAMRGDGRTLRVAESAQSILNTLNNDFGQQIAADDFTSAEFALEMIKGVVKVDFIVTP